MSSFHSSFSSVVNTLHGAVKTKLCPTVHFVSLHFCCFIIKVKVGFICLSLKGAILAGMTLVGEFRSLP